MEERHRTDLGVESGSVSYCLYWVRDFSLSGYKFETEVVNDRYLRTFVQIESIGVKRVDFLLLVLS